MTLPKMDVPIDLVEWELFVPEQFKVDHFDGNLIDANLLAMPMVLASGVGPGSGGGLGGGTYQSGRPLAMPAQAGQIAGVVVDTSGALIPGARVTITSGSYRQVVTTDANGTYIASNVPSGAVTISADLEGFKTSRQTIQFDQAGRRVDGVLSIARVSEQLNVVASSQAAESRSSGTLTTIRPENAMIEAQKAQKKDENEAPSLNIQNLQRRASGVLPVRIDVPRAGSSHRFVKPLVVDDETEVTFRYKRR
jgi:hypothetical protein